MKRKHINDWNVSYPGWYIDKFRMLWFLWATHRKVAQNGRLDGHPAWVVVSKIAKRRENNRFSQETTKRAHKIICPLSVNANFRTGGLRLNLNPLNLMRWIDSWPFDKTWKPGWIDSTAGLWISSESSSWRRVARESRSRRRRHIFFCTDRAGYDGDRFNAVRLFHVISGDSAERDSLDESSAFLIEGAHWSEADLNRMWIGSYLTLYLSDSHPLCVNLA